MSAIEAMQNTVTIAITNGVSDGNLYIYLVITAIRTIKKMKKTDDSKRVVIGRFLDFILRIIKNALCRHKPVRMKKLASLLLNFSRRNREPISHMESKK